MSKEKIYLGEIKEWGSVSIEKHSWDCEWYWGFGYLGNAHCHFHLESLITGETDVKKVFDKGTWLSQSDWWIIRDLAIQAYGLKTAAEVYRHGGHQTSVAGITDKIKNLEKAKELNKDLEIILNSLWEFIKASSLNKVK